MLSFTQIPMMMMMMMMSLTQRAYRSMMRIQFETIFTSNFNYWWWWDSHKITMYICIVEWWDENWKFWNRNSKRDVLRFYVFSKEPLSWNTQYMKVFYDFMYVCITIYTIWMLNKILRISLSLSLCLSLFDSKIFWRIQIEKFVTGLPVWEPTERMRKKASRKKMTQWMKVFYIVL